MSFWTEYLSEFTKNIIMYDQINTLKNARIPRYLNVLHGCIIIYTEI